MIMKNILYFMRGPITEAVTGPVVPVNGPDHIRIINFMTVAKNQIVEMIQTEEARS